MFNRELEAIYEKYGVPMKPCENIEEFVNEVKIMSSDRPLLFEGINQDL